MIENSASIQERIGVLIDTLDTCKQSLLDCPQDELHIGVRVTGRILNVFHAQFDFSPAVDEMINPKLNVLLIRQWSKTATHLNAVRHHEIEIIEAMRLCMKKRLA